MTFRSPLPAAFLLLCLLVALRDVAQSSVSAGGLIFGGVAVFGCLAWWVDVAARELMPRLPERTSRSALRFAALLPWLLGLVLVGGSEDLHWATPLLFAACAAGTLFATGWLATRFGHVERVGVTTWCVALTVPLALAHGATGTLLSVRPGTEALHVALFVGTAFSTLVTASISALSRVPSGRARYLSAMGSALLGAAYLEVDRRALVGLYPFIHALLACTGLLLVAQGFAVSIEQRVPAAFRRVASVALMLSVVAFVVLTRTALTPALRARLHALPLGATLLELLPVRTSTVVGAAIHPALGYPRHFDAKPLERRPNVLLVTVDALRADALGEMKTVSALAKESASFTRAYAQGSRTAIGMGTLLTGRYSATMDWRLWAYTRGSVVEYDLMSKSEKEALGKRTVFTTVPQVPSGELLAERLREVGYRTSAVPFAGKNEFFRRDLVFARGFDEFVDLTEESWAPPTSPKLAELSIETLGRNRTSPWFHWVHFYDPHESKRDADKYRQYIHIVDDAVREIFESLRRDGEWENTAFVLTADHGEAFGEHRHNGHGTSLYEEQVRVPLVMRVPGMPPGEFDEPVATIDATATLAQMTGANTRGLDGTSLLPRLRGEVSAELRPIFTELHRYMSSKGEVTHDIKGVIHGNLKLVWDRRAQTLELFDLASDPAEARNRIGELDAPARDLEALLRSFLGQAEADHPLPNAAAD